MKGGWLGLGYQFSVRELCHSITQFLLMSWGCRCFLMTQDSGERWGNPLLHPGMPGRAKGIMDSTATRTSLPGSSRTHQHTLEARCWFGSPQRHHAVSQREDACVCIAYESPHSLHSTKSSFYYSLLGFFWFFFARPLPQGRLLERCSAAPTPATSGATPLLWIQPVWYGGKLPPFAFAQTNHRKSNLN